MDGLSKSRIEANLRRWAEHGVDHKNPDHVQAYLLARQQCARPRPEHVLAIIRSKQTALQSTASLSSEFWLFSKFGVVGEPAWFGEWGVTEQHLRDNFKVPADCDLDGFWIVDAGCPRHLLGKGTKRISFEEAIQTTMGGIPDAASAASAPASAALAPVAALAAEARSLAPASAAPPAPVSAASAPASAAEAPAQPPSKKQRVLKMMQSDDMHHAEDLEATSLEELISKIKKAAKSKQLHAPCLSSATTVHFWATQVVGALKASTRTAAQAPESASPKAADPTAAKAPEPTAALAPETTAAQAPVVHVAQPSLAKSSLMLQHFPPFLLKVLYNSKGFEHLKDFVTIFRDLVTLGCVAPCNLDALEAFAKADPLEHDVNVASFAPEDLTARMRFFSSVLFQDFQEKRTHGLLKAAQCTTDGVRRQALLDRLLSAVQSQESDEQGTMHKHALWAQSAFGQGVPDEAKVKFVLGDARTAAEAKERLDFALSFSPASADTVNWRVMQFLAEPEDVPAELDWGVLEKLLKLLACPAVRKGVRNPAVGAFLDFVADTAKLPEDVQQAVRPVVAKCSLQATHWEAVPDRVEAATWEESVVLLVAKALGKVWPFQAPPWVQDLRQRAATLRTQRKEAAATAPDEDQTAASAPEGTAASAPEGTVASVPTAALAPGFVVGDIVKMKDTVGKAFWGQEAQVLKVTGKQVQVKVLTAGATADKIKKFSPDQLLLIHGSVLRKSMPTGRQVAAVNAPASAALAPASAALAQASDAGPSAEDLAAAAAEKDAAEAKRLAASLMEDSDDDA